MLQVRRLANGTQTKTVLRQLHAAFWLHSSRQEGVISSGHAPSTDQLIECNYAPLAQVQLIRWHRQTLMLCTCVLELLLKRSLQSVRQHWLSGEFSSRNGGDSLNGQTCSIQASSTQPAPGHVSEEATDIVIPGYRIPEQGVKNPTPVSNLKVSSTFAAATDAGPVYRQVRARSSKFICCGHRWHCNPAAT